MIRFLAGNFGSIDNYATQTYETMLPGAVTAIVGSTAVGTRILFQDLLATFGTR